VFSNNKKGCRKKTCGNASQNIRNTNRGYKKVLVCPGRLEREKVEGTLPRENVFYIKYLDVLYSFNVHRLAS